MIHIILLLLFLLRIQICAWLFDLMHIRGEERERERKESYNRRRLHRNKQHDSQSVNLSYILYYI